MIKITIPLPPVTKKNSGQIQHIGSKCPMCKRGYKVRLASSKAYQEYEKNAGWFLKPLEINYPVNVKAVYYMKTKGKVDLNNLHNALHDVLVKYNVLEDDNSKIIVSTDGSRVDYDKEKPRTEVEITKVY